jgi:hypothetical protein
MRSRPLLFGTLLVAGATAGAALWLGGEWPPRPGPAARAADSVKARVAPTTGTLTDPGPTGAPPPHADLGSNLADLSRTPSAAAAALFKVESRLYTRLDSASATAFGCDEGMPSDLLFAADVRVLDVSGDFSGATARLELTSVARARDVTYEGGCDLTAASVEPGVRVDTIGVYLQRDEGRWELRGATHVRLEGGQAALAGPLRGIATADWDALAAQADSVRRAHGQPLARPWPPGKGHYDPYAARGLFYPDFFEATCPSGQPGPGAAQDLARLAFAPVDMGGIFDLRGPWFAIYETKLGGCVAPVTVTASWSRGEPCGSDADVRPTPWWYKVHGIPRAPGLLVQNVAGLRTGPAVETYTVVPGPGWEEGSPTRGWTDGALVFSGGGEVLRVVEVPPEAGARGDPGFYLNAWYRGRRHPLLWVDEWRGQTWGVYWAGLLDGDDIPDLIIRTTRATGHVRTHTLFLLLSSSKGQGPGWRPSAETVVIDCA